MAFVQSPLPPEQQNQFSPQGQTTPNPLALLPPQAAQTGGSVGQGGGATSPTAPGVGSSTQFGSNASRLSDYLQANQDQVQQMASTIAGNLGGQFNTVQNDINQAGSTFGAQVSGSYTPTDPTVLNQVQTNPIAAAQNPDTVSSFQKQLGSQYTGPTSFESSEPYAKVQGEVSNAIQNSQLDSPAGLSTYLQNNVAKGQYTPGQNTLDTVILQGNQPAYQTVQNATKPFQALPAYLQNLATTQNQSVQAAQKNAEAARQAAQQTFGNAVGNLNTNVSNELADAQRLFTANQGALNKFITGSQTPGLTGLTVSQLLAAGVDPAVVQSYSGLPTVTSEMQSAWTGLPDLGAAPGTREWSPAPSVAAPTAAKVATPQDYQMLAALSQLSGGQPFNAPISAADAAMAGTYTPPSPTLRPDNKALAQDLYSYLNGWSNVAGLLPTGNGPQGSQPGLQQTATTDYASLMNSLAQYLGLPAFNANFPTPPPPTSGGGGPPFLGPPGGDVHSGTAAR